MRRRVPGGRLHLDQAVPFLCVTRRPEDSAVPVERLLSGQGAQLIVTDDPRVAGAVSELVRRLAATFGRQFGAFLVLELWIGAQPVAGLLGAPPCFCIQADVGDREPTSVAVLAAQLRKIRAVHHAPETVVEDVACPAPPGLPPLLDRDTARDLGVLHVGVEVPPYFCDPASGQLLPLVFRRLQRDLGPALQHACFDFAQVQTSYEAHDFRELGRRGVTEAIDAVDRALAEIGSAFDYLLAVNPVNADQAWEDFVAAGFREQPSFQYRPLTHDPAELKRQLFDIAFEAVEDPTLGDLFRAQRRELERKLTLLEDRGTRAFLPGSIQLYGGVDDGLLALAETLRERAVAAHATDGAAVHLDAEAFARLARAEVRRYRALHPGFDGRVQIRDDVPGVMVSRGQLLIGARYRIIEARAAALLAHEVGTHVVTAFNGQQQPLRQLRIGLAGYEESQEGLAVFAEYVAGGLTPARLALVAARVVAVQRLIAGRGFVDVFEELCDGWTLSPLRAFDVTMRVFRGGGLTKDAIYLRGLTGVLDHLAAGGELDPLFVGKLPIGFVPVIEELQLREVLHPAAVHPRWLNAAGAADRLAAARAGMTVLDLIDLGQS